MAPHPRIRLKVTLELDYTPKTGQDPYDYDFKDFITGSNHLIGVMNSCNVKIEKVDARVLKSGIVDFGD